MRKHEYPFERKKSKTKLNVIMKNCLTFFMLVVVFACEPSAKNDQESTKLSPEETAQDSLFNEMMAIHDEVMPEMDHIFRLQKKLKTLIDSLQNEEATDPGMLDSLTNYNDDLQDADEAMMHWMRSNDFEFEGMEHEEIMTELASEKENIIVVREKMLNSIRKAEDILQQIETP
ncbi:hypothetical protein OKW21_000855 [Catalinimonas alkaloidigena]|uniref:hypothetical protein n=1 Tax=Catalinimonas alkaloidigena TaxID=1075417 RepID=UPI002404FC4A|nr:hypothetical protein [Catalinimonas alkaloidigena]MDF9795592.1 hypothetical protein [Catalinimonas alkaloidigena]